MAQGKAFTEKQREMAIKSLEDDLRAGLSRNMACAEIGLKPQTLSNWVKADEALGMKLASWENTTNRMAISNIQQAIKAESEDPADLKKENSWKWAERKMKSEFSTRTEQTGANGKDLPTPLLAIKK